MICYNINNNNNNMFSLCVQGRGVVAFWFLHNMTSCVFSFIYLKDRIDEDGVGMTTFTAVIPGTYILRNAYINTGTCCYMLLTLSVGCITPQHH